MGLFDAYKNGNTDFSEKEAFIAILIAGIGIDGDIAEEELQSLLNILNRLPSYKDDFPFIKRTYEKCLKVIRTSGAINLLDLAIPKLSQDLYQTTFTQVVDILIADGVVGEEEERFVEKLVADFGLDENFAQSCIQVVSIKNRVF